MTPFDIEVLLAPLDGNAPSGPNLEYDSDFQALERAATPKAAQSMGDSVISGEEPDWGEVADRATALLARSKDLRVALHLATARLRTIGLPGWSSGLELIRRLLETFWDDIHPQLDAEDDNDPTFRVNSLAPLGDVNGSLRHLRTVWVVQSQRIGRVTLRDLRIANGSLKLPPPGPKDTPPAVMSMAEIDACCMDCPEEMLVANTQAAVAALAEARAIDKLLDGHLGSFGPNLKNLITDQQDLQKFLSAQFAKRMPAAAALANAVEGGNATDSEAEADSESENGVVAVSGKINGAADVLKRIDEICDYYARVEPSSPVPMLLRRAQSLVGKDFLDLLKDLAPGGVDQLKAVTGVKPA